MGERLGVIGSGAWGTAIAALCAAHVGTAHESTSPPRAPVSEVLLWGRDRAKLAALAQTRRHQGLGAAVLPEALRISGDPAALRSCTLLCWAVPCQHTRTLAQQLAAHLPPEIGIASLSKGLELTTTQTVCGVLAETLGAARPLACLTGPSLASEVAAGQPLALVAAGPAALTSRLAACLHSARLRVYLSEDRIGAELCGALKNVIAIAAGLGDGLRLGDNAKAALVTRGLAELRRLGRALGADDATFAGLAGLGDLMATCTSRLSRNRRFGEAIAQGGDPQVLLAAPDSLAEGAWTCRAAVALAARYGVELPIASQVESVIWHARPPRTALEHLLARTPKDENA